MKKTNVIPLQEIKAQDVQRLNDYLESQITMFADKIINMSSGVIFGMDVTQNGASGILVSSGAIFDGQKFGELEDAGSGMVLSVPASGSRTDVIVSYYEEVYDGLEETYVLLDPETQEETYQEIYTRKFGAAKIAVIQNSTASAAEASGYVVLAEVTLGTSGISDISTDNKTEFYIKNISGDYIKISSTSPLSIKEYIELYTESGSTALTSNSEFKTSYTKTMSDNTYSVTIIKDCLGVPYKIKTQKNSEDPKYFTVKYYAGALLEIAES